MKKYFFKIFIALTMCMLAFPSNAADQQESDGVHVRKKSAFTNLVPANTIERGAAQQYELLKLQARQKEALAPDNHPQVIRLRNIAKRMLPHIPKWNERARSWNWEVNLIGSSELNAFCMPGGKIAFFSSLISRLELSDSEIAAVMGHEIAHALREHARERMGKQAATNLGANVISQLFGLGNLGNAALNTGANLLALKYSRDDETEADIIGLELGARAGYDPSAAITLWKKMEVAAKRSPPQWLSTHPAGETRIKDIKKHLPEVLPIFKHSNPSEAR